MAAAGAGGRSSAQCRGMMYNRLSCVRSSSCFAHADAEGTLQPAVRATALTHRHTAPPLARRLPHCITGARGKRSSARTSSTLLCRRPSYRTLMRWEQARPVDTAHGRYTLT